MPISDVTCEHRMMARPVLDSSDVREWLARRYGSEISAFEVLPSGFWSAAFGFEVDGRELVLRVGTQPDGFAMDQLAYRFGGAGLPVPQVLDVGDAFGFAYAISTRFRGRFLEMIQPGEASRARPEVLRLLDALRTVPAEPNAPSCWYGEAGATSTWRGWITDSLADDPRLTVSGWRSTIAADGDLDRLYRACEQRIARLLEACPERRELVHGDLLNHNVLIALEPPRVTAVFSWKCSVRGDGVYDLAWCTFWSPWHPGVAALELWAATKDVPLIGDDAEVRHHCYLLHIGLRHLGFHAWTGNNSELQAVAARAAEILDAGIA